MLDLATDSYRYLGGYIVREFVQFQKFKSVVTGLWLARVLWKMIYVLIVCVRIAWLVLAPVTDLTIATALVYFLRSSRTGFQDTDDVLTRLTRRKCIRAFLRII